MRAIIAVNNLGYIGLNNELPWKCSEDLKHFKNLTENHIMLVGKNTFKTLPEIVKKRKIVVDYREVLYHSTYPQLNLEGDYEYIPYICIGGKVTYEKYCHLFTELHISHIDNNTIGDIMFPNFSNLNKDCKIFNYYFKEDII